MPPNSLNSKLFREWLCSDLSHMTGWIFSFFITQFHPTSRSFRDPPHPHCFLKLPLPDLWDLACARLPVPPKQRPYNRIRAWSLRVRTLPISKSQQKPLEPFPSCSSEGIVLWATGAFISLRFILHRPCRDFVSCAVTGRWECLPFSVCLHTASAF